MKRAQRLSIELLHREVLITVEGSTLHVQHRAPDASCTQAACSICGSPWMTIAALPDGCGCFAMNGGTGSCAYPYGPQFALVVEVGAVHAYNVDGSGLDLTLASYPGGPRFYYHRPHARFVPYGQALPGAVRATGGLAPANASATVFGAPHTELTAAGQAA